MTRRLLVAGLLLVGVGTAWGVMHAMGLATGASGAEVTPSPTAPATTPPAVTDTPTATEPPVILDQPVTVRLVSAGGETLTSVIPAEVITSAAVVTDSGTVLDGALLAAAVDPRMLALLKPAADARFRIVDESVTVVPARTGYQVTPGSLAADVASVLTLSGEERDVLLTPAPFAPAFTTQQARDLGVVELVSSYSQRFPPAQYRTINIGRAARYITGTLLMPGQVFSMNDTIGERTPENGYTEGWIIGPDGVFTMELGGAVSTITTAMFNAAWFAGLDFVEHRAHSIYIPRYPAGREATVSWGDFDMKFRNTLTHPLFITVKLHRSSVAVYFWGTKEWQDIGTVFGPWTDQLPYRTIYNTDALCHDQDGIVGFRITTWRTFIQDGKEVRREAFHTHYAPSPHVICGPEPSATATVTPTSKPTVRPRPTPTPSSPPATPEVTPTTVATDTPTA